MERRHMGNLRMGQKGRIVLPVLVRIFGGFKLGDRMDVFVDPTDDSVLLVPVRNAEKSEKKEMKEMEASA